ncbi:hypothetical protein ACFP81_04215 [Deinococcus lacus]|uniref:Uncharacterized protein n=1 Tax=Deinococcus lacus TaxID=392561 RepID=A0ABW1YAR6_9DEIO
MPRLQPLEQLRAWGGPGRVWHAEQEVLGQKAPAGLDYAAALQGEVRVIPGVGAGFDRLTARAVLHAETLAYLRGEF